MNQNLPSPTAQPETPTRNPWLGLLGGGQLGRMFCMAAQSLGFKVMVLDPAQHSPAGSVADAHIAADYLDEVALEQLGQQCIGVTTEFENVPALALEQLAQRTHVSPSGFSVSIAQHRLQEKSYVMQCGVAVAPHHGIASIHDITPALNDLLPGILKTARMGYDGKGQVRVDHLNDLTSAFQNLNEVECVLEKRLPLHQELSVIVARSRTGESTCYPVAENCHHQGILAISIVPARVAKPILEAAQQHAMQIAKALDYVGVLCVEFFLLDNQQLVVNEIAPRPHNSGHFSIDACLTSQFEQQARILANLPLGSTRQHSPAVMLNILGESWFDDEGLCREPDWAKVLALPNVKLHLYGKDQPRVGRKMGHITILGENLNEALQTAKMVQHALGLVV